MRRLMKNFWHIFLFFVVCLGIFYFLVFPPRVISTTPLNQAQDVGCDSSLIIKFDKPVKRQELQHLITPKAYGEWKFKDPLIENHLYRALVFTPAIDLEPDTQYQVKIENMINPLGLSLAGDFSFNFKTQKIHYKEAPQGKNKANSEESSNTQSEALLSGQPSPKITLLNIDLDWQNHPLSCEAASLKMALAGKGVYVSETDIMKKIGYDLTSRQDNIWGNPYQVYVGNIDGEICSTGYGVYWQPIAEAAKNWREAEAFSGWNLRDLTREIKLGNPVIVWGALPVKTLHDCSWHTPEGKYIKAFQETHVRLAIGFIGDSKNPSKIILNDPLAGRLYWNSSFFLTNWEVFGYSGVVIK